MFLRAHCNAILLISIVVADISGQCQVNSPGEGSHPDGVRTCRAQNLLQLDAQGQPIKKATSVASASIPVGHLPLASFVQLGNAESKPSTKPAVLSLPETKAQKTLPSVPIDTVVIVVAVSLFFCLLVVCGLYLQSSGADGDSRTFAQDHVNTLLKGQHGPEQASAASQVMSDKLAQGATPEEAAMAAKDQVRKDQRIAARKKGCC